MTSLLIVPLAIWEAPLDAPEIMLLAMSKAQRDMAAGEREAKQFRVIRSLPFYEGATQ